MLNGAKRRVSIGVWFEEPMNIWTTEYGSIIVEKIIRLPPACFATLAMAYDFSLDDLDNPRTSHKFLRHEIPPASPTESVSSEFLFGS